MKLFLSIPEKVKYPARYRVSAFSSTYSPKSRPRLDRDEIAPENVPSINMADGLRLNLHAPWPRSHYLSAPLPSNADTSGLLTITPLTRKH